MKKTLIASLVAAAGLAVAGVASALPATTAPAASGTMGMYAGIGINHNATFQNNFNENVTGYTFKQTNDNTLGFNVFVGQQFDSYFGAELGFSSLGDEKFKLSDNTGATGSAKNDDQYNVYLDGLVYLPVNQMVQLYGIGGVSYFTNEQTAYASDYGNFPKQKLETFALDYGAGVQVNVVPQFAVRASYVAIQPAHQVDNQDHNIPSTVSLDAMYYFG